VIEVVKPGPLTTVQDGGRLGLAHLGVPAAGPADWLSHALANRLVGNPDDAAALEFTLTGPTVRLQAPAAIAVVGAPLTVDGAAAPTGATIRVTAGQQVAVGTVSAGVRGYLAVAGGIDTPPILGSRSTDTLAGLGPPRLAAGDTIGLSTVDERPLLVLDRLPATGDRLRVVLGPRDDWFTDPDALVHTDWIATDRSDRVGMRLAGRPLQYRWPDRQLPSEGATRGAIQVPPNGLPVILGPDHPVTGGYPVIGVVADADIDKIAQIRPGQHVRLHWSRPRRPNVN